MVSLYQYDRLGGSQPALHAHHVVTSSVQRALGVHDETAAPPAAPCSDKNNGVTGSHPILSILQGLGIKTGMDLANPESMVACINELLLLHQRATEGREELREELQKAKVDLKLSSKTILRLQHQMEQKQQELGEMDIKSRQMDAWYRGEVDRWNAEHEEITKKLAVMEQRHVQFQHELRRKDGEYERLQEKLRVVLADRGTNTGLPAPRRSSGATTVRSSSSSSAGRISTSSGGSGMGSRIGGSSSAGRLTSGGGSSSSSSAARIPINSKQQHQGRPDKVIADAEVKIQDLARENIALRRALTDLQREHKDLLNSCTDGADQQGLNSRSSPRISDDQEQQQQQLGEAPNLLQVQQKLELLKAQRKQACKVLSHEQLQELRDLAQTHQEQLLIAQLQEASSIMQDQEQVLALALQAIGRRQA